MIAPRPIVPRRATLARAALLLPLFVALLALPGQAGAATPRDIPPPPPTIAVPGQTPAAVGPVVRASHASVSQARPAAPLAPAAAPDAPTPPPTVPPPPSPTPPATPTGTPTLPPNSSGTNLSVSPTHGLTGTVLAVNGTGFVDNADIHLHWDGRSQDLVSSSPRTDGNGHFYVNVTIPRDAGIGGNEIAATDGHKTAYALVTVDSPTTNTPDEGLCVDALGAHLCIPTPSSIVWGLTQMIAHFWGNVFTLATAGFNPALTSSPDLTKQHSFTDIHMMQTELSKGAGGLLVFFLTIGVLAGYLTAIGRAQFQPLLAPIGRAIFVTGFVAGYDTIMGTAFGAIKDFADGINGLHERSSGY